jgi:hypothetical protein
MPERNYPTWLDRVPSPEDVQASLKEVAGLPDQPGYLERAGGDQEFALWLRLADQHAAAAARETRRAPRIGQSQFPWRGAYVSCWSPRGAAEAVQEGLATTTLQMLQQAQITGRPATAPPPEPPPGIDQELSRGPEREL